MTCLPHPERAQGAIHPSCLALIIERKTAPRSSQGGLFTSRAGLLLRFDFEGQLEGGCRFLEELVEALLAELDDHVANVLGAARRSISSRARAHLDGDGLAGLRSFIALGGL